MILYKRTSPKTGEHYVLVEGNTRTPEASTLLKLLKLTDGIHSDIDYTTRHKDQLTKLAEFQSPLDQIKQNYPELFL